LIHVPSACGDESRDTGTDGGPAGIESLLVPGDFEQDLRCVGEVTAAARW
jgi:hypothetical protein